MKSERGITLITLVITIIIMIILAFTTSVNIRNYQSQNSKTNFIADMKLLKEEVEQFYSRNKSLPIALDDETPIKFDKDVITSKLTNLININDNNNYYIIDTNELGITTNLGKDLDNVIQLGAEEDITNTSLDVYIINEQSHTIYYPKGIKYDGITHYKLEEIYTTVYGEQKRVIVNPSIKGVVHEGGEEGFTFKVYINNVLDEMHGNDVTTYSELQPEGATIRVVANNTKGGYTTSYDQTVTNNGSVNLNPTWTIAQYSISYNLDGGSMPSGVTNPESYSMESESITLNNPTKSGYFFAGWTGTDVETRAKPLTIQSGSIGDRTYTANWVTEFAPAVFNYTTNTVQTYTTSIAGKYKLEVWGAQGGEATYGGTGAYASGTINLNKNQRN